MLFALLLVGMYLLEKFADSIFGSVYIMVAGYEKPYHLVPVRGEVARKDLFPCCAVKLHLLDLSKMRHVAEMDYGIDILFAKMLQRGNEPLVRPVSFRIISIGRCPQMRVAYDAEHEIRLVLRLPSWRGGKNPPTAERAKPQRRGNPAKEILARNALLWTQHAVLDNRAKLED